MSANIKTTAPVHDIAPARPFRLVERQSNEVEPSASIMADFADSIEVTHTIANLAGYSNRARDLIFVIASRTHNCAGATVEMTDEAAAELQGCSTKTVQRQRADYKRERRAAVSKWKRPFNPATINNELLVLSRALRLAGESRAD